MLVAILFIWLLCYATWKAKSHIELRENTFWEAKYIYNGRSPTSASDDRRQHHSSQHGQFWFVSKGEVNFVQRQHKCLTSKVRPQDLRNHEFYEYLYHCIWWDLELNPGPSGPNLDAITTRLPTAFLYVNYNLHYNIKLRDQSNYDRSSSKNFNCTPKKLLSSNL